MQVAIAQDTATQSIQKTRVYYTDVFVTGKKNPMSGTLASMSDSLLYISSSKVTLTATPPTNKGIRKVNYERITRVNIKRRGTVGRSLLHGALIGMGVGVIAGFVQGDDPPCHRYQPDPNDFLGIGNFFGQLNVGLCEITRTTASQKAFGGGVLGMVGGAAVGTIVGLLVHKTFIIGGNKEKFHTMKAKLLP